MAWLDDGQVAGIPEAYERSPGIYVVDDETVVRCAVTMYCAPWTGALVMCETDFIAWSLEATA